MATIALVALGVSAFGCTKTRSQDPTDGGADHPTTNGDGGGKDGADAKLDMAGDTARDGGQDTPGDGSVEDPGCTPNATQCMNLQPQTCDSTRHWVNTGSACSVACSGGLCTGGCTKDATRCNNLQPQVCDATGAWHDTGTP
jgi:hypothetical protein